MDLLTYLGSLCILKTRYTYRTETPSKLSADYPGYTRTSVEMFRLIDSLKNEEYPSIVLPFTLLTTDKV